MKENKYDDESFYNKYSRMSRSVYGLEGAGEWYVFRKMFPDLKNKKVLDLGCGFGWHCQYAAEQGAKQVIGIDISKKMLELARKKSKFPQVEYRLTAIEDIDFPADSFDVVISSLAFHYIESFDSICRKVNHCLINGGYFVFSVEHPVFTAYGNQDWFYDADGNRQHWPVDRYYEQGKREAVFLGEKVVKYHKTMTAYIQGLLNNDFELIDLTEAEPSAEMLEKYPDFKDELRRPMILLISARKK